MESVQLGEGVRIALSSLRANKLRTFLTLLGNIVGVMSVIAVVSLLDGIDLYAREKVLEEGSGIFSIQRINPLQFVTDVDAFLKSFHNPRLTLDDVSYLREHVPSAAAVGARRSASTELSRKGEKLEGLSVRGRTWEYPGIEDLELAGGRHLARFDVLRSRPVCVLGHDVAEKLFEKDVDPLGKHLRIAGRRFQVIGIAAPRGAVLGSSRDRFVLIPITTYGKIFGTGESLEIRIKAKDVRLVSRAIDEATVGLRIRHHLRPSQPNDFAIITSEILLDLWKKIEGYISYVLLAAVSISLVVGGIVLMNVMLVAVTDRTREIGVRKALGATRRTIVWQFLVEAVTLSVVGGLLGTFIGFTLAFLVSVLTPLPSSIQLPAVALGLGVTFILGIVFGTVPAYKACSLDPVEALRHE